MVREIVRGWDAGVYSSTGERMPRLQKNLCRAKHNGDVLLRGSGSLFFGTGQLAVGRGVIFFLSLASVRIYVVQP